MIRQKENPSTMQIRFVEMSFKLINVNYKTRKTDATDVASVLALIKRGGEMKKITKTMIWILVLCMTISISTLAASGEVVEKYTGEDSIIIYVRSQALSDDVSAQIGTSKGISIKAEEISKLDIPMRTLVMIDNSVSIKESDRSKISDFLQNLISDRIGNEQIAIATFDEEMHYLCEYSSDYATLKTAIDSIGYNDQETYLTDVLYEVISKDFAEDEEILKRIVIVSDGVDNKALGYTKEELYDLLKTNVYPIYTIGCYNKKKSNNEQLENMFALSRKTGVPGLLFEDVENTLDITSLLKQDWNITKYTIVPEASQMDGSTKTVKLSVGGTVYTTEMTMPQKEMVVVEQPGFEEKEEPVVEEQTPEPAPEREIVEQTVPWIAIIAIIVGILLIAGGAVGVVLYVKRSKEKRKFQSVSSTVLEAYEKKDRIPEITEVLISVGANDDEGKTVGLWNQKDVYRVIFTDINSPAKTVQVPLTNSITIGRRAENDVVFDYEKSLSGRHCEIFVKQNHFYLRDLQSSNGSFVNGSKALTEVEIFSGNILKLGRLELRFEVR